MHDYAFVGNDAASLLFLKEVFEKRKPKFIITGEDRFEGRGRQLTPSVVADFARENSAPCIKTGDPNNEKFFREAANFEKPDFFLVFSFGFYLRKDFLCYPKRMCVNIHPSILPSYRGAAPLNRSIMNCDRSGGVSFFKMTSKMDAGPLIISSRIFFDDDETSLTYREKAVKRAAGDFLSFDWDSDFALREQDESKATIAPKIGKEELEVDLSLDAGRMKCRINGLSEHGVRCVIGGRRAKLRFASLADDDSSGEAGRIEVRGKELLMQCAKGMIRINLIQPEGRQTMSADSFINGYKIKNGERVCAEYSE